MDVARRRLGDVERRDGGLELARIEPRVAVAVARPERREQRRVHARADRARAAQEDGGARKCCFFDQHLARGIFALVLSRSRAKTALLAENYATSRRSRRWTEPAFFSSS